MGSHLDQGVAAEHDMAVLRLKLVVKLQSTESLLIYADALVKQFLLIHIHQVIVRI